MPDSTALQAALEYFERGWSVFPVTVEQQQDGSYAKKPLVSWEQFQKERPARDQLEQLFSAHPNASVALALGKVSGVVRVDIDCEEADAEFRKRYGDQRTLQFRTPSGGRGLLFLHQKGFTTEVLWKGARKHEELRFMSDGRYTVVPPSPGYEWTNDCPILPLPPKLVDELLSRRAERALRELEQQIAPTVASPEKQLVLEALKALNPVRCDDRDCWLQVGMSLHSAGDEYLEHWAEWSRGSDKFKEGECERLWASFSRGRGVTIRTLLFLAKQDGWEAPKLHEPLTDVGNGRTLARACAGLAMYVRAWKDWLWWDGARWKPNAEFEVVAKQKAVVRDRCERAVRSIARLEGSDDEKREKLKGINKVVGWCVSSESAGKIHAAVDMARSEPGILVDHASLDQHPWLLCCINGTLDLRTGELKPHDPSQLITQLCPTEYWPEAAAPRWMQFLDEVFEGKAELVRWVQKLFGYCLTGRVSEHVLPIFYGTGRNGKSTLIKTALAVLGGDYAGTTPSGFLALSRGEQHPTKLAELYGKRFVADLETSDGMKLNEELVKRITGGDQLQARRMFEDFWSFQPTHKLILATNYEPKVRGVDTAIWSRIKKVPFAVSFLGREDHLLDSKLAAESSGILRWMVEGCFAWQKEGLQDVDDVKVATEAYRSEQDSVAQFVSERVEKAEGNKLRKSDAAAAYRSWCAANSTEPVNAKTFGLNMGAQGVASDDTGKFYVGIKLS